MEYEEFSNKYAEIQGEFNSQSLEERVRLSRLMTYGAIGELIRSKKNLKDAIKKIDDRIKVLEEQMKPTPLFMLDMRIDAPEGTMVMVLADPKGNIINGTDWDKEKIIKYLKVKVPYTILKTRIGGFSTDVYLKEIGEDVGFNSTNFYEC